MVYVRNCFVAAVVLVFSLIAYNAFYGNRKNQTQHSYAGLNVAQMIEKFGYPLEIHNVTTEDGYQLTLHRIPHGKNKKNRNNIPILLMHGFLHSASEFVNLGPGKALSLLLADEGFDVWLGNARGTTWSRRHRSLDPDIDSDFWNFTIHEIGYYDIPAKIDHILNTTGEKKLHYLGFSQGASVYFIMVSEKPEYVQKIRLMTALAPAIFLQNSGSPVLYSLTYVRDLLEFLENMSNIIRTEERYSQRSLAANVLKNICDENSIFVDICLHIIYIFQGFSEEQMNKTLLTTIFSNLPAGASNNQMLHFLQCSTTGKFQKFDYGKAKNLEKYDQEIPHQYNISRAVAPTAVYYGKNDYVVPEENALQAITLLPNVVKSYLVPHEKFSHNDFLHAKDADKLLYGSVIQEILKH